MISYTDYLSIATIGNLKEIYVWVQQSSCKVAQFSNYNLRTVRGESKYAYD